MATSHDLRPYRTGDGSFTLRSAIHDEGYHSVVGAITESTHVFINAGLQKAIDRNFEYGMDRPIDILEVGLGTGLNMLLTWIRCLEGKCRVNYHAIEPFPLSGELLRELAYYDDLAWPGLNAPFLEMMLAPDGKVHSDDAFRFTKSTSPVHELKDQEKYDLVYYDAFGPNTQPEMWTTEVFERIHRSMRIGGILVTYCAKGEVRRTMRSIGFTVERTPGPPGKREMLRAFK